MDWGSDFETDLRRGYQHSSPRLLHFFRVDAAFQKTTAGNKENGNLTRQLFDSAIWDQDGRLAQHRRRRLAVVPHPHGNPWAEVVEIQSLAKMDYQWRN